MRQFRRRLPLEPRADHPSRVSPVPDGPLADLLALSLVVLGAALVTWAYREAPTTNIQSYDPVFWAGMFLAYLAAGWRALVGRHAVLWLGLLGLFTLLPKFLLSPSGPVYFDETAHFALLQNIISAHKDFQYTPLLPIGTFYPGMESVAASIHWLTGLSAWGSARVLLAAVHCLLPIQIYYIARALPVPHRWAAVAGLFYATNPSFVYDDVQFAYESVAILLMLVIVRLYVEALAAERSGGRTWGQSLLTALLIAVMSFGLVVTHHLTSLTGVGLLLLGALFIQPVSGILDRKGGWRRLFVRWTPVLTLGGCFTLWVVFVVPQTWAYLFPHVSQPVSQALAMVDGHSSKASGIFRSLFSHSQAPGYERVCAFGAPVLISLAALAAAVRWLRKRELRSAYLWPIALSAIYLASLPLTLLAGGAAGAHRTWASTYVGVAMLPAALGILFELHRRSHWLKRTAVTAGGAVLAVLLVGNVASGTPIDYRYPGPYMFGSDTRDVTAETLRLTNWVQTRLGTGAHVVTDRFTALALAGRARAFTPFPVPSLPIAGIWYNHRPPVPSLIYSLQRQRDDYLAVDVRDTQHTPTEAPLFLPGEPALVPAHNMARIADWPWLRLMYSSQHYRLYRINFDLYYLWYPFHAEDH